MRLKARRGRRIFELVADHSSPVGFSGMMSVTLRQIK
jgi:hypothetical protein